MTTVLGILPGTRADDEKPKVGSILSLISDELDSLAQGFWVYDALTQSRIRVRVFLLTATADYRGWEVMLGLPGAPNVSYACYKCWLSGVRGPGKHLYGQGFRWLSQVDILREEAKLFNNPPHHNNVRQPYTGLEMVPATQTKEEHMALLKVGMAG